MDNFFKDQLFIAKLDSESVVQWYESGYYYILWLEKGSVIVKFNNNTEHLVGNKFLLIPPGNTLEIELMEDSIAYCIGFSIEFLRVEAKEYASDVFTLFINHSGGLQLEIDKNYFRHAKVITLMLLRELKLEQPSFQILQAYMKVILLTLIRYRKLHLTAPDINIGRIHDFFMLIYKFSLTKKRVSFYASELNLSSKRLNQILNSYSLKSASYYIQENVFMEAKRLLISGKFSIKEVGEKLGFEDCAYFSRCFKKWAGISPDKYRLEYISKMGNYSV
ncbi:helix-turn-helix domain-containing protein [Flavobacterium salmonis]|uniref:AraC family transcriptional regulator n=1 Tax=Flavobacterium salmonis TaxID=2654844 RepID=A0A6V6Z5X5_9FLAO|nr:helix-turn-helix transcriptional regulator [Flavobacterium salmonis]CAD0007181.1 AraC family transcriptional regulator [Flavobacterium salmonis]